MDEDAVRSKLQALWQHVTNVMKRQIVNPTLWMAMESCHPVTLEGSTLVLGIDGTQFNMASIMEQHGIRSAIEKQLSTAANRDLHFRVIHGDTMDDWSELKERERVRAEMANRAPEATERKVRDHISAELVALHDWDDVVTNVHRVFSALNMKSVPQARAQYIFQVMPLIFDAENRLEKKHIFLEDRGLSRVIEKVAQLAETDPTTVAVEYVRYRDAHLPETTSAAVGLSPSASANEVVPQPLPESDNS